MAYWARTPNGRIKIYDSRGNYVRQKDYPQLYEGIEQEPNHNIESRLAIWEEQTGDGAKTPAPPPLDAYWTDLIENYFQNMQFRSKGKRDRKTALDHKKALTESIIPFFTQTCRLSDPNRWPTVSDKLMAWMLDRDMSEHKIFKANAAVKGFWDYLKVRQKVMQGMGITVLSPDREEQDTPLPRLIEPPEVFRYIESVDHLLLPKTAPTGIRRDLKLMALLGYFFSLRPQEIFALRRRDFVAGSAAAEMLAARAMAGHKLLLDEKQILYGRLCVEISRQRQQDGRFRKPKAYSRGWVSCFSAEGAKLLVKLLMDAPDKEALLFHHLPDRQFDWWKAHGIGHDEEAQSLKEGEPKIALKDFRRASLLWLGHFTTMDMPALKGHARHKKEETTWIYMRRPGEKPNQADVLDLDA